MVHRDEVRRSMFGKTRLHRVKNRKIKDELGQFHMEGRSKIKWLKWFGPVVWM